MTVKCRVYWPSDSLLHCDSCRAISMHIVSCDVAANVLFFFFLLPGFYFGHDDSGTFWHHGPNWYQAECHSCGHPYSLCWYWSGVYCAHCTGKIILHSNSSVFALFDFNSRNTFSFSLFSHCCRVSWLPLGTGTLVQPWLWSICSLLWLTAPSPLCWECSCLLAQSLTSLWGEWLTLLQAGLWGRPICCFF